jgi:hypothetical protein
MYTAADLESARAEGRREAVEKLRPIILYAGRLLDTWDSGIKVGTRRYNHWVKKAKEAIAEGTKEQK